MRVLLAMRYKWFGLQMDYLQNEFVPQNQSPFWFTGEHRARSPWQVEQVTSSKPSASHKETDSFMLEMPKQTRQKSKFIKKYLLLFCRSSSWADPVREMMFHEPAVRLSPFRQNEFLLVFYVPRRWI